MGAHDIYASSVGKGLKGHGQDVSAYLRDSLNSASVVKSTCTLYATQLEYQTVGIIRIRKNLQTLTS